MSTTMGINKDSNPKRTRSCFRIPDELKLEIVRDYLLNGINQYQIAKNYGIGQQSVSRIIRNFASSNDKSALLMKNRPTDSQADEIKALREEVMELKKKLHSETMRADFYDTMIDVAEEMFNIEIRKKAGTGQEGGSYGIAPYGTAGRGRGCALNFVSEAIIARMGTLFKGK